ncbi:MAG: hypothetical protein QXX64_01345 [Nitrososphaera sp.]
MISRFVNREKAVRSTALSFAVVGTIMHGLNIMHATNSTVSQVWSIVAIIGFFLTVSNFVNKQSLFETGKRWHSRQGNHLQNNANHATAKNDVFWREKLYKW